MLKTLPGLSPKQCKRLLASALTGPIEHYQPIMLVGSPGAGKTAVVGQSTSEVNMHLRVPRAIQHETIDFTGLPAVANGKAAYVPFDELLPSDPDWEGVIFLDEITQLPADMQKVIAGLLDKEGVAGKRIPRKARFVLAGNSQTHRAGASRLLSIIQNRCLQIELLFSYDDWKEWAVSKKPTPLHPIVRYWCDYAVNQGKTLFAAGDTFKPEEDINATPRTIEKASDQLYLHDGQGDDFDPILQTTVASLIGADLAADLMVFRQEWRLLHDFGDKVLTSPKSIRLPDDKPSLIYAMTGAVAGKVRQMNGSLTEDHLRNLIVFAERLSDTYSNLLVLDVCANTSAKTVDTLCRLPEGKKWLAKYQAAINAGRDGR